VGNWSGRKIKDFTTEEIKTIIDECKSLGAVHFTIHGGEIFLRDDVKEIVDYLKKKRLYVNIVTNGILLPKNIDKVKNIDSLCISLDGTKETNDFNRGRGSFDAAFKAIKLAKEKNLKFVVHATLTKKSVDDIEYLCNQAKEIGYYQQFSLLLKPLNPFQTELGLAEDEAKLALRKIIKLKKEGYPVFTSFRTLNNALNWSFGFDRARLHKDEIPAGNNIIRCFYGKRKIAIDANGFVFPCSSLNDSFKALNVLEVGVKKAYEHVLETNTCESCYYLTQNDWNLLLGGSVRQFMNQAYVQLSEILKIGK
jgi:MoaA/NifB/PqqE/SkfB family radical SAM enzyme